MSCSNFDQSNNDLVPQVRWSSDETSGGGEAKKYSYKLCQFSPIERRYRKHFSTTIPEYHTHYLALSTKKKPEPPKLEVKIQNIKNEKKYNDDDDDEDDEEEDELENKEPADLGMDDIFGGNTSD